MGDAGGFGGGGDSSDPGGPPNFGSPFHGRSGKAQPGCVIAFFVLLAIAVVACCVAASPLGDLWNLRLPPP